MPFKLINNPILYPYQVELLRSFFALDFAKSFFLTGGTALSAFYFAHRESKDLDLFSLEDYDAEALNRTIADLAQKSNSVISIKVKSNTYNEIYLENTVDNWIQRIDFVKEQPVHFGEIKNVDGIRVDSLENIGSNKVLTIYNRLEPKDYIDLYFILQKTGLTFERLFALAKEKDAGLFEFYFAQSLENLEKLEILPMMRQDFDKEKMIKFYQNLQENLLRQIKPAE